MYTVKNTRNREVERFESFEEFKNWLIGGYEQLLSDFPEMAHEYNEVIYAVDHAEDIVDINRYIAEVEDYSDMYIEMYV